MDFNGIREILDAVNKSEIAFFEYETSDGHLVLDKSLTRNNQLSNNSSNSSNSSNSNTNISEKLQDIAFTSDLKKEVKLNNIVEDKNVKEESNDNYKVVKAPMVGTFYSSSSPEADSFVKVGDTVKNGDILCIIEAMKLMNEIESEVSGTIKEILVKDGDMVEYGQPLFKIEEA